MKIISTTMMRKHISEVVDTVKCEDSVFGIGRRNKVEAIIMKFPQHFNKNVSEITNINANSKSLSFLKNEPDLYSVCDLEKRYV